MASHGSRKARGRERAERGASRSEHVLFVRLTAGEHAIYQQVAAGARLTVSEWARRVLHAQTLPREAVRPNPTLLNPNGLGGTMRIEDMPAGPKKPGETFRIRLDARGVEAGGVGKVSLPTVVKAPGDPDLEF